MKMICIVSAALMLGGHCLADDDSKSKAEADDTVVEDAAEKKPMTGREREQMKDEIIAEMVDDYNEAAESEMDEVVCKKESVTGSRRKVRICKTRREIAEEKAAAQRSLLMRNRAQSDPAASEGMGSN